MFVLSRYVVREWIFAFLNFVYKQLIESANLNLFNTQIEIKLYIPLKIDFKRKTVFQRKVPADVEYWKFRHIIIELWYCRIWNTQLSIGYMI